MQKKRRGLPTSSQDMHDVSFAMRRGGSGTDFRTSGHGDRNVTVAALLGKECAEDIIDVSHSSQFLQYTIAGMLTKPLSSVTARSVQMKKTRRSNVFRLRPRLTLTKLYFLEGAQNASFVLEQHGAMLDDYFSLRFERQLGDVTNDSMEFETDS
uniref:Kinesin motor domain-containing protein n=1 Tax=Heterorhabditis bacteriophora TaxID=37862 RepID=A0A1I7XIQ0_HETBA